MDLQNNNTLTLRMQRNMLDWDTCSPVTAVGLWLPAEILEGHVRVAYTSENHSMRADVHVGYRSAPKGEKREPPVSHVLAQGDGSEGEFQE